MEKHKRAIIDHAPLFTKDCEGGGGYAARIEKGEADRTQGRPTLVVPSGRRMFEHFGPREALACASNVFVQSLWALCCCCV